MFGKDGPDSAIWDFYNSSNDTISFAGLSSGISGGATSTSCPFVKYRDTNMGKRNNYAAMTMETLFAWEHNRIALELKQEYGWTNDEYLFQEARARNIALIQKITFTEYIPIFLAYPYTVFVEEYDSSIDATVSTLYCTLAQRYSHSAAPNKIPLSGYYDDDGQPHYGGLLLFVSSISHIYFVCFVI